jgi:hypothetical protein
MPAGHALGPGCRALEGLQDMQDVQRGQQEQCSKMPNNVVLLYTIQHMPPHHQLHN